MAAINRSTAGVRRAHDSAATKDALLHAASVEFARHGYRDAGLRAICERAKTLPGSVHYHFGSKSRLYRETLVWAHQCLLDAAPPPDFFSDGEASAEERLAQFLAYMLDFLLLRRPSTVAGKLFGNELHEPTEALGYLVETIMKPIRRKLVVLVSELAGEQVSTESIESWTDRIMAMVVFYEFGAPVLTRFGRPMPRNREAIDTLAVEIASFSRFGIEGADRSGNGKRDRDQKVSAAINK